MEANESVESVLADVLGPPGSCVAFLLVAVDMVLLNRPETLPRVAMDAAGNAIAVWHQVDSLYYSIFSVPGRLRYGRSGAPLYPPSASADKLTDGTYYREQMKVYRSIIGIFGGVALLSVLL